MMMAYSNNYSLTKEEFNSLMTKELLKIELNGLLDNLSNALKDGRLPVRLFIPDAFLVDSNDSDFTLFFDNIDNLLRCSFRYEANDERLNGKLLSFFLGLHPSLINWVAKNNLSNFTYFMPQLGFTDHQTDTGTIFVVRPTGRLNIGHQHKEQDDIYLLIHRLHVLCLKERKLTNFFIDTTLTKFGEAPSVYAWLNYLVSHNIQIPICWRHSDGEFLTREGEGYTEKVWSGESSEEYVNIQAEQHKKIINIAIGTLNFQFQNESKLLAEDTLIKATTHIPQCKTTIFDDKLLGSVFEKLSKPSNAAFYSKQIQHQQQMQQSTQKNQMQQQQVQSQKKSQKEVQHHQQDFSKETLIPIQRITRHGNKPLTQDQLSLLKKTLPSWREGNDSIYADTMINLYNLCIDSIRRTHSFQKNDFVPLTTLKTILNASST